MLFIMIHLLEAIAVSQTFLDFSFEIMDARINADQANPGFCAARAQSICSLVVAQCRFAFAVGLMAWLRAIFFNYFIAKEAFALFVQCCTRVAQRQMC